MKFTLRDNSRAMAAEIYKVEHRNTRLFVRFGACKKNEFSWQLTYSASCTSESTSTVSVSNQLGKCRQILPPGHDSLTAKSQQEQYTYSKHLKTTEPWNVEERERGMLFKSALFRKTSWDLKDKYS